MMQIISAKALNSLEVPENLFNDLEYLIALFVTKQKEGLKFALLPHTELQVDIQVRLEDLGFRVNTKSGWLHGEAYTHTTISWKSAA